MGVRTVLSYSIIIQYHMIGANGGFLRGWRAGDGGMMGFWVCFMYRTVQVYRSLPEHGNDLTIVFLYCRHYRKLEYLTHRSLQQDSVQALQHTTAGKEMC